MKTKRLCLTCIRFVVVLCCAASFACSKDPPQQQAQVYPQPTVPQQPGYPAQAVPATQPPAQQPQATNPLGSLVGALGQLQQGGGAAPGGAVALIPWQSLSSALPVGAAGWTLDGQVEGQTAAAMGMSVS